MSTPNPVVALKKMTTAEVMGLKGKEKLPAPEKTETLFIVMGVVTQAIIKPTQYNEGQFVLYGRFEAIRARDGVRFSSDTLYLPEPMQTRIGEAVNKVNPVTGEVPTLEVALKVSYTPSTKSAMGYTYLAEQVLDITEQDRLSQVRTRVNAMLTNLLPAPAPAAAASKVK